MKKLLFLLIMAAGMVATVDAGAQTKMIRAVDTIANTTTRYNTSKFLNPFETLGVQFTALKVTGTVSGYARVEGTINGTDYEIVPGTDSLTIGNTSPAQTKIWQITGKKYTKTRVTVIPVSGTFTQSAWYY